MTRKQWLWIAAGLVVALGGFGGGLSSAAG